MKNTGALATRSFWRYGLVGLGLLTGCRAMEVSLGDDEPSLSPTDSPLSPTPSATLTPALTPALTPTLTPAPCALCEEYDVLLGGSCSCSVSPGTEPLTPLPSGTLSVGVIGSHDEVSLTLTGGDISLTGVEGPEQNVLTGTGEQPVIMLKQCDGCSLEGLTLTDGGGGLLVEDSQDVTANTVWLVRNTLSSPKSKGGGMWVRGNSSVFLSQGVVFSNSAPAGGGFALEDSAVVEADHVWISSNLATTIGIAESGAPLTGDGGGIWVGNFSRFTLTYGLLERNAAERMGDAIYLASDSSQKVTLSHTVLISLGEMDGLEVDGYGSAQLSVSDSIWVDTQLNCPTPTVGWSFVNTFKSGDGDDCSPSPTPMPLVDDPFLPDDPCYHLREDSSALLDGKQTGLYSDDDPTGWDLDGDSIPVWSGVGEFDPAEGGEACEPPWLE